MVSSLIRSWNEMSTYRKIRRVISIGLIIFGLWALTPYLYNREVNDAFPVAQSAATAQLAAPVATTAPAATIAAENAAPAAAVEVATPVATAAPEATVAPEVTVAPAEAASEAPAAPEAPAVPEVTVAPAEVASEATVAPEVTVAPAEVASEAPAAPEAPAEEAPAAPAEAVPSGPVVLAAGSFIAGSFPGDRAEGSATIYQLEDASRLLRLEAFSSTNGPDLFVILSPNENPDRDGIGEYYQIDALKGNVGDQNYVLPADLDLGGYRSVVIWCRAFNIVFGYATLQ